MQLRLPYGDSSLLATLDEALSVEEIAPPTLEARDNEEQLLKEALSKPVGSPPLQEILHRGERTVIVVPDPTRVAGQRAYLPHLLEILNSCGVSDRDISIVIACGSHPLPPPQELRRHVGEEVYRRVRVVPHDCQRPEDNVHLGHTQRGIPVTLNRSVVRAERLIVTGAVWFHYFAGFGGGPKLINPGCAALETILANHRLTLDPEGLGLHPGCRSGNLEGNPVYEDIVDSLKFVTVDFALQTVVDDRQRIVACWAGDLLESQRRAAAYLKANAALPGAVPYPVVIASAGGHPHDVNLVQAHKGLLNACRFLQPGGTLVLAAECGSGVGSWGLERCLQYGSPEELYAQLRREFILNGNTALSLLLHAKAYRIILVSDLPPEWVARLGFDPARDLQEAIDRALAETEARHVLLLRDAVHAVVVD
ncbi:MAG: nickel-dependent lactate racemase [candidate division KSB1 bacterium]|nr:nickel-dependent lactate racemase [candidate division KSB1 bacterium]